MMIERLSWSRDGEILFLSGELEQNMLNHLWDARYEAMEGIRKIDLHGVSRVDTAGVALLIHLVAIGKAQGAIVTITGWSESIYTLAQLYHLPDDVLPR